MVKTGALMKRKGDDGTINRNPTVFLKARSPYAGFFYGLRCRSSSGRSSRFWERHSLSGDI
jgi:hypothetical protein